MMNQVPIREDAHAVVAAQWGRRLAVQLGFSLVEQTAISTAILEIARNIAKYAGHGQITLHTLADGACVGIEVIAADSGPGIADIALALQDGYTTGKGLGLGLPGARRLMDSFEIVSQPGAGTTITMRKWRTSTDHRDKPGGL
ncbi:MAG: anti-sigma regulatory factor [Chloroflexi bacterium]|nr:anti-sigma regulatory factor [Chloroflexota bacterium]